MEQTVSSGTTHQTSADYKAAIEECLAEMARLNERTRKDQADIARLKTETRALLEKLKVA